MEPWRGMQKDIGNLVAMVSTSVKCYVIEANILYVSYIGVVNRPGGPEELPGVTRTFRVIVHLYMDRTTALKQLARP